MLRHRHVFYNCEWSNQPWYRYRHPILILVLVHLQLKSSRAFSCNTVNALHVFLLWCLQALPLLLRSVPSLFLKRSSHTRSAVRVRVCVCKHFLPLTRLWQATVWLLRSVLCSVLASRRGRWNHSQPGTNVFSQNKLQQATETGKGKDQVSFLVFSGSSLEQWTNDSSESIFFFISKGNTHSVKSRVCLWTTTKGLHLHSSYNSSSSKI